MLHIREVCFAGSKSYLLILTYYFMVSSKVSSECTYNKGGLIKSIECYVYMHNAAAVI